MVEVAMVRVDGCAERDEGFMVFYTTAKYKKLQGHKGYKEL